MLLQIKNLNKITHKGEQYNWVKCFEFDYHYTFHIDGYFTGNEYYIQLERDKVNGGYKLELTNTKYIKDSRSKTIITEEDIRDMNKFIQIVEDIIGTVVDEEKWANI